MLLISSASNPEVRLVLGFCNAGSFWLALLSSQLLCRYHSVSYCLFLLLITLTILHFFHVLSHYPICYSKIVYSLQHLVFHYRYSLYDPSFDKLVSDSGEALCWYYTVSLSPHISLQLWSFCMESLFHPFYRCSYSFFFMLYFLSSTSYFSYLLISPLLWRCLCVS